MAEMMIDTIGKIKINMIINIPRDSEKAIVRRRNIKKEAEVKVKAK